jgi:DNA-binding MarR family transcriptional regulator
MSKIGSEHSVAERILSELRRRGAATVSELEIASGIVGSDVTSELEELAQKGLVVSHRASAGDQFIYTLSREARLSSAAANGSKQSNRA